MTHLSQHDRTIIVEHPLDDSLDHLQDILRKAERSYQPDTISYDGAVDRTDQGLQKATSRLLVSLMGSDVAIYLPSRTGNRNVASDLLRVRERLQKGDFNYEHYRALSRLVIKKASDVGIWTAVFDLIITLSRISPPASIPPSFDGTPITHSSASQQGSEQTKDLLEEPLFHEIKNCTYRGVDRFFSKYFEGKEWSERGKEIYNAMRSRHIDGRWSDFPDPPLQDNVYEWLFRFQDEFLSDARGVYYTTRSASDLTGAEAQRQLDLFVKRRSDTTSSTHKWKDVHVIGEHKQSKHGLKPLLLQLGRYIRDVFTAQPTRRFIHGFFLHGTIMELWVFDRSGPYSSGEFDVHKEPEQFIRAIAGYAMMSDEELGLDTYIERDGGDLFITITEDATGEKKRLQLERTPLIVQRAIVCRGTNCYRTKDSKYVAKFAWASDKRPSEADLLRIAHKRGVKGVARLLGYHRITSIEELRDGLTFPTPYHFRNNSPRASSSFSHSQSQLPLSQSFGPFQRLSFAETSSKKRKSTDREAKSSKRSRSNSQTKLRKEQKATEALENTRTTERKAVDNEATPFKKPTSFNPRSKSNQEVSQAPKDAHSRKRKSQGNEEKSSKRSRSNSQTSSLHQENEVSQVLESTQASSFYDLGDGSFKQRLFGCLAISPAGQTISKFDSIPQLLMALRDAIKAHRSLYFDGNILHRDISENNIIITDPEEAGGFNGMLIDCDLSIEIDGRRTGARQKTGTMEFMAIEVLREFDHTYRHDLESFFYVLIWICARRVWEREFKCKLLDRPKESMLTDWYTGSYKQIAQRKRDAVGVTGFEELLDEFPRVFDCVKPLCREIRGILFPYRDGLFIGTPSEPEELYGPIIHAFDEAITKIASAGGSA